MSANYILNNPAWLGEIPSHWDCKKIGSLFTERKVKVSDKEYPPLSVAKIGVVPQLDTAVKTDAGDNRKLVRSGDFVINSRSDRKGSCGVSELDGSVSLINIVLTPRSQWNSRYVHYLLRSHPFSEEYYRNGRGIVADLWTTRYSEMKSILLPVPPRPEQDQIVRFLNWKVSSINWLINIKKAEIKQLEELKLSQLFAIVTQGLNEKVELIDSGIEHIGLVPSHWKVLLNHRIYKENCRSFSGDETVLSLSQKDGLLPYVEMKERSLHTASYENWKLVLPNDLVLNRFKAHLGVFFSSNYRGIVTFHYGVYEPIMKVSSKYYEVLFHTPKYKQVFAGASNGMTVGLQNLSNTNFYKVYTVYPPYEEQCAIVAEVQKIENEMQAIISTISEEIGILHEFKTRLISDVVTGKIDVRDIEIPEYEFVEEEADNNADNDEETERQGEG